MLNIIQSYIYMNKKHYIYVFMYVIYIYVIYIYMNYKWYMYIYNLCL